MKILVLFAAAMLVAACGGGSSSSGAADAQAAAAAEAAAAEAAEDASEPVTYAGKVIDGYISGATVCLDINNNFLCDPDEPSALSGAGGSYEFSFDGTVPAGTQILADIPIGAVDEDLGPIEKPYNLMAPSDNPAVVTPLTTLVSQEVLSSGNELSSEEAEEAVKVSLGFSEETSLLDNDFVENEETELQAVAEVVAVALAVTKETIEGSELAEGLTPAEVTKAAVATVKNSVSTLVANGTATVTKDEAAAATATVVSGQVQNIVTATKSGDGEVVSLVDAFIAGDTVIVYEGEYLALDKNKNGVWDEAEEPVEFYDTLALELIYYPEAAEGSLVDIDDDLKIGILDYDNGEWLRSFDPYASTDKVLVDNVWSTENETSSGGKIEKNCITFYVSSDTPTQSYCFVRKDLSGLTVNEAIPGICLNDDGSAIAGCDVNAELPSGSYVYDLTISTSENAYGGNYVLYGGDWDGYVGDGGEQTIDGFIAAHSDLNTSYVGENCNTAFRVGSYDADSGTGVMQWGDNSVPGGCSGGFDFEAAGEESLEETNFEIVTFGDTKIFKTLTPKLFRANNGFEEPYIIFAATTNTSGDDVIFQGRYTPSNTKLSLPFTGNTQDSVFASRVAVDFLFVQAGIPAFPYELFIED
ncbi:hypothetical protein N9P41_01400 [Pseudomonadales bacterium]|nr:hypothetical protein [Pseudomonadales bacterium]